MSEKKLLSERQIQKLKEHKYKTAGATLLDPCMQKYWVWLVEQIPLWVAPNTLTLAGLLCNGASSVFLMWYSMDGRSEIAPWACIFAAIALFVYQSLDAIDGKQARRTNSSSPLGELFDHGCDSVSTIFVIIGLCVTTKLGDHPDVMFVSVFLSFIMFYLAHWQTYVSGTLRFGLLDVTEAQWSITICYLITGLVGTDFWAARIPLPIFDLFDLEFRHVPVFLLISCSMVAAYSNFGVILNGGVGRNGSTVADSSVIFPFLPLALAVGPAFAIAYKSKQEIFSRHPALFAMTFGMVAAKTTNRLIVAHMTRSEMKLWDTAYLVPALLICNQYFDASFSEHIILWICLVFVSIDFLWYSYRICREICDALRINCFHITPKLTAASSHAKSH